MTPVDAGVAKPLIEGLATETVVTDPSGMEIFADVERTPLREALAGRRRPSAASPPPAPARPRHLFADEGDEEARR